MKIENAIIESTFLGYEDHGILTFVIGLKGACFSVGFGNVALDQWSEKEGRRVAQPKSMDCIAKILEVVGVDRWEDLKGKHVRIAFNDLGSTVTRIGNIIENKWLDLEQAFEEE